MQQNIFALTKNTFVFIKEMIRSHSSLLVILLLTLIVSKFYYTGYYLSDETGTYVPDMLRFMAREHLVLDIRIAVIIVQFLSFKLFGSTINSIPVLFAFIYPALVFLSYILTLMLSNKKTALLAAILVAASSGLFLYSGAILPDNLTAMFVLLGYISFISALKSTRKYLKTGLLILFSFFVVMSYLTKQPAVTTFAGCLPLLLIQERGDKKKLLNTIAIIVVSGVAIYLLILAWIDLAGYSSTTSPDYIGEFDIWNKERGIDSLVPHTIYAFGILQLYELILMLGSALVIVISSIKKKWVPLGLSASVFLYILFFGAMTLTLEKFVGVPIQFRYYAPIFVLMPIAIALFLNEISPINFKRFHAVFIAAALLTFMIQVVNYSSKAGNIYRAPTHRLGEQLVHESNERLPGSKTLYYSDTKYAHLSNYYNLAKIIDDSVVELQFIGNPESNFVFDPKGFYFGDTLRPESILGAAIQYAESNDLLFITDIIFMPNNRAAIIQPWVPWTIPAEVDYSEYLLYGYFPDEHAGGQEIELLNSGFEEWNETGAALNWQTRLDNYPATQSDIAYAGEYSLTLETDQSALNYIYQRHTITNADQFDFLELSIYATSLDKENQLYIRLAAENPEGKNLMKSESFLVGNDEWEQYHAILPVFQMGPEITITVVIEISQEGMILVDDLSLLSK